MAPKVETKLTLDDLTSATLSKIKAGFEGVSGTVDKTAHGVIDFGKQIAATAIGVNIGNIFESIKGVATSSFQAAQDGQQQMRELMKVTAGMSKERGISDFSKGAEDVYDKLTKIGREAKVAREDLVKAFAETGTNTTKTSAELTDLIGKVAGASRALSAPVSEVVAGFAEIEKNTISATNPLIAMVKQANIFRGHNEAIAMRLQSMGRAGMLNVMNKALAEMNARAKKMPPTLKDMQHQFEDMKTDVMRLVGQPMVSALSPAMDEVSKTINENRAEIEKFAHSVGVKAGEWIVQAVKLAKEGFGYLQTHSEEIKNALLTAFNRGKEVFSWIVDHKELLAGAAVASKLAPAAPAALQVGKSVVGAAGAGGAAFMNTLFGTGSALSAFRAGLAASVGPLTAFVAALAGVAFAANQAGKLWDEMHGRGSTTTKGGADQQNFAAYQDYFKRFGQEVGKFTDAEATAFNARSAAAMKLAAEIGEDTNALRQNIEAALAHRQALAATTSMFDEAASMARSIPTGDEIAKMADEQAAGFLQAQTDAAASFARSFNEAARVGNTAALNASVQVLAGSKSLQDALLESGKAVGLNLEELGKVVGDKLGDFGKNLLDIAKADTKASGAKPPVPTLQFNGGQTFNIKQDFRDSDPDRILTVFREDLLAAAENRIQARTSTAYGG